MLQRDYIMRLVRQFIEALEKLVEEKKKEDGPEFQLKIQRYKVSIEPILTIAITSIMNRMRNIF